MSSEFGQFEHRLRSLSPVGLRIDRDELLYEAGIRDGGRCAWRACRRTLLSDAAAAALLAVAGLVAARVWPGAAVKPAGEAIAARDGDAAGARLDPGVAFSDIHNVDSWGPEELQKHGIAVRPGAHPLQSEDPPRGWVEVAFDPPHDPATLGVVMTARFVADDGATEAASRVQEDGAGARPLSLRIAVEERQRRNSSVDILVWGPGAGGGARAWGYKLSAARLLELAGAGNAAGAP